MPKKVTRYAHLRETGSTTAAATTGPVEKTKRHRSVHIEPRNSRRWLSLKKRLGFPTDDELVAYLLDLADSITSHSKNDDNHDTDESSKVSQESMEKELPNIIKTNSSNHNDFTIEIPRRSQRNQVVSEESQKHEKFEKTEKSANFTNNLDKINQQDSKLKSRCRSSKTKRHKNKARHHKEKRKKRKHQKVKDAKDLLIMENRINNKVLWQFDSESDTDQSIKKLQNNCNSQTLILNPDKAKLVQKSNNNNKSIKVCLDVKNIDVTFSENSVSKIFNQEEINDNVVKKFINQDMHLQNTAEESNNFLIDCPKSCQSSTIHTTNILSEKLDDQSSQLTHKILNNKYDHTKYEYKDSCDLMEKMDKNDDVCEPLHKPDKKRLKGDYQSKKYHDIRKAPQDGVIDENQEFDSSKIDSTPINILDIESDNNILQCKETIKNTEAEPPRLAIRIKLCQECNSRHLQNACPLTEPAYTIKDSVSIDQWVEKYNENSEVMKAFSSIDPMSQGYTKYGEDGIESDEELLEHDKRKMKIEYEEKQQNIDSNRPLYARESLPECLELKVSNMDHGLGVYVKSVVPMFAQLGPLIGKPVQEMDIPDDFPMRHIWEIEINNKTLYISTTNPLTSNWIRYVRPAETKEARNVAVISKNGELFLVTSKSLIAGTELTYWSDSQSTAWARKNKIDKTNCGGCNLNFLHPIYYRLHCCIFHDTNYSLTIRKYHCKVCGAAVLGKDNIMKHAAQLHAGRGAYQCQYCKKFFLRLNYLEMHRTYGCSQNPQRSRPLCDFCGRKFCQPQKLKVHIKRMHSGNDMSEVLREFQCKLCLKLLGSRAALQRHMKEVHHKDVVGAATCDRCGKMFQNKSNLKIHMLTHSGVKPFKCKENGCKAAFTTKQCLQFHYKKVHGLSEEMMPKIERSVAYTFDAYSGGLVEDAGRGKTPKFNVKNLQENSDSLASFDDCSSENNNTSSAAELPCELNKQIKDNDQSNLLLSVSANTTVNSPIESAESDIDLYGTSRVASKVNKKWLGEFDPVSNTQSTTSVNDIYDFQQENRSLEEKIHSSNQNLIDDSKLVLNMYRRTESANASLLVEAALDAAERDIGAVSSPILEDSDREANLYSIPNELEFKTSCSQNEVVSRSPESHLNSYMQEELSPSPGRHTHSRHTPDHIHLDYHISRPVDYVSPTSRTHNIEQYLDHQDIQRVIHVSQDMSVSPTRYQEISQSHSIDHSHSHLHGPLHPLPHHLHDHHQHHQTPPQQQEQVTNEALSSDEGDSVAQNLSLPIKEKTLQQLDLVKYDGLESDFPPVNRDRVRFESLIVQAPEDQGLDMTARGFQQTFESQVQNNNNINSHHHHLYGTNERERQGVDLSRTSGCISPPLYASHYTSTYPVDIPRVISLESSSRSHHLHTSVSRIIASPQPTSSLTSHILTETLEARIISPPPPPIPTYNSTYSVGPTSYTPRSGYHYSGYY